MTLRVDPRGIEVLKAVETKDLCRTHPRICAGSLGKIRSEMPQLEDRVLARFVKHLEEKEMVPAKREAVAVHTLKPTQKHLNAEKVLGMAEAARNGDFPDIDKTIIVDAEGYILDGHHRWAALYVLHPKNKIHVVRLAIAMEDLIRKAKAFGGVKKKNLLGKHAAAGELAEVAAKAVHEVNRVVTEARGTIRSLTGTMRRPTRSDQPGRA